MCLYIQTCMPAERLRLMGIIAIPHIILTHRLIIVRIIILDLLVTITLVLNITRHLIIIMVQAQDIVMPLRLNDLFKLLT